MKVDRYNYASQFGDELHLITEEIRRMLVTGNYILTEEVSHFEAEFANYLGAGYVQGVNTGTDALIIALLAVGIEPGDEVITQANTFNATVTAIIRAGGKPVLVDAEEASFLINESQVETAVTARTRVILPVHLYGKPTPLNRLLALAEKHDLHLVEDAAQAHGARTGGRRVGTFGAAGCFSFHPSKNLAAAGDGGAIVTNHNSIDELIRRYRNLGQHGQNNHVVVGLNSKLDSIQALILSRKLPNLDYWNAQRRIVAGWYKERLSNLPLQFQSASPDEEHVYHLFQIRAEKRDQLLKLLLSQGIDAVVRYPTPIHLQPAFAHCGWRKGQFPVAEKLANELVCLPIRPDISLSEVDFVADKIRVFYEG
jgi:dTDP-4-amino-4,6-dideoxygalactose transaminase